MPTSQIAYINLYNAINGAGAPILQRLQCAVIDYAFNTVATEGAVTGHTARVSLATTCINNPFDAQTIFALPVAIWCGDNNVPAPTDAQLLTAVGAVWNLCCGNI